MKFIVLNLCKYFPQPTTKLYRNDKKFAEFINHLSRELEKKHETEKLFWKPDENFVKKTI